VAGLNLKTSGRASAAVSVGQAGYSNQSVTDAAFGPGATTGPATATGAGLSPTNGPGLAFWGGVVAIAVLVFVRSTLPR
jgi:hypothetical protein